MGLARLSSSLNAHSTNLQLQCMLGLVRLVGLTTVARIMLLMHFFSASGKGHKRQTLESRTINAYATTFNAYRTNAGTWISWEHCVYDTKTYCTNFVSRKLWLT